MKLVFAVSSLACGLLATTSLGAAELKGASLAGLSRVGAVIVTVSSDTVTEAEVREAVESRLAEAKITVEDMPGPELLVSVSAERSAAETRPCQCGTFRVALSLREAVILERSPERGSVGAITWRTGGAIRRFSTTAPRLAILETLQEALSAFTRSVASDTQQAEHLHKQP